jgi:hypothetical protein
VCITPALEFAKIKLPSLKLRARQTSQYKTHGKAGLELVLVGFAVAWQLAAIFDLLGIDLKHPGRTR